MAGKEKIGNHKFTNWEWLLLSWNSQNDGINVDNDLPVPDYRKLK